MGTSGPVEGAVAPAHVQLDDAGADDVGLALDGALGAVRVVGDGTGAELVDGGWRWPLVGWPGGAPATRSGPDGRGVDGGARGPDDAAPVGEVVLEDPELVPFARVVVTAHDPDDGSWSGELARGSARTAGPFASLHRPPAEAPPAGAVLAVPTSRPLLEADVRAVAVAAEHHGARVRVLALTGEGRTPDAPALVRALRDALSALPGAPELLVVPLSRPPGVTPEQEAAAVLRACTAYGATDVLVPRDAAAWTTALAARPAPVPVRAGPALDPPYAALVALLADGADLPGGLASPAVAAELRALHPPRAQRGLVLLFTGLSGSGKSTLAQSVVTALVERTARRVTVLDGDRVRTLLSAGLGFSRSDRDLNVLRLGWVAAEVARHGGVAVCAPIAPYAATRAAVRARVERHATFVLVHVSTPLEVCEARDRKGLYARARAGAIPHFTGISDPYEVPTDADVAVDTSTTSLADGTERVLALLHARGLVEPAAPA